MEEPKLKVTLASRVDPDLKEKLFQEARENGFTPSAQIEAIIQEHFASGQENSLEPVFSLGEDPEAGESVVIEEENMEDLHSSIESAEIEQEDSKTLLPADKAEPSPEEDFPEQIADLIEERDHLVIEMQAIQETWPDLNEEEKEELHLYLEKLKELNPDQPEKNLLLGSLLAACRNEKSLFQWIPAVYWKSSRKKRLRSVNLKNQ